MTTTPQSSGVSRGWWSTVHDHPWWTLTAISVPLCGLSVAWALRPPGIPDLTTIQHAYERESADTNTKHDKGLQLINANCVADQVGSYLCWIKFVSVTDTSQRIFFDAVTMAYEKHAWRLKSGLCKTV